MAAKGGSWKNGKFTPAGGGAGSATADQQPLGDPVDDTFRDGITGMSDVGNLFAQPTDEVDSGNARPDPEMVAAFRRGETLTTPALVVATGVDSYRAVDPMSARIAASAREAGVDRFNTIEVRAGDTGLARTLQSVNGRPTFVNLPRRTGLSDVGNLMSVPSREISTRGRVSLSQSQIDSSARAIRRGGGRNLTPIPVREVGPDRYVPVGNGVNMLAIANRANINPWIYITGRDE